MKNCDQCDKSLPPKKKRFCCNKCKDRYHNTHNPRGLGKDPAFLAKKTGTIPRYHFDSEIDEFFRTYPCLVEDENGQWLLYMDVGAFCYQGTPWVDQD